MDKVLLDPVPFYFSKSTVLLSSRNGSNTYIQLENVEGTRDDKQINPPAFQDPQLKGKVRARLYWLLQPVGSTVE